MRTPSVDWGGDVSSRDDSGSGGGARGAVGGGGHGGDVGSGAVMVVGEMAATGRRGESHWPPSVDIADSVGTGGNGGDGDEGGGNGGASAAVPAEIAAADHGDQRGEAMDDENGC